MWMKRIAATQAIGIFFALLMTSLLVCTAQRASAEGASIQSAKLEVTEDGYQLNAQIELSLTAAMEEAVRKGVPL